MLRPTALVRQRRLFRALSAPLAAAALTAALLPTPVGAESAQLKRYTVVFKGTYALDGTYALGGNYALNHAYALSIVRAAGGTVTADLSRQIGVMAVASSNALFAQTLRTYALVEEAAEELRWKAFESYQEAIDNGHLTVLGSDQVPGGGPQPHADPLEALQWSMRQIRAPQAHAVQAGSPLVEVGILDSGIDATHVDLAANVDCAKGRDFVPAGPSPLSVGTPCNDNQFHGTHVAGIVAAKANGHGVVGVAPNVRLIPVKVCDTSGFCYSNSSAAAITYAGDAKFEVINMSYFVDDNNLLESTEFKCASDPVQRAFRKANERAINYARNQGVVPVAALGNSDQDLAHPVDDNGQPISNECEVVPAETEGVIGTMALGPRSEKAYYSNYGVGMTDVGAPGGNPEEITQTGSCDHEVLSTLPGNVWGCISGTSMASPHAAGVAALIVSQFGQVATDAGEQDVVMRPQQVEDYLQGTTIDLVTAPSFQGYQDLLGYDLCFGNGRVDALKAVTHDTTVVRQAVEPCPAANRE